MEFLGLRYVIDDGVLFRDDNDRQILLLALAVWSIGLDFPIPVPRC